MGQGNETAKRPGDAAEAQPLGSSAADDLYCKPDDETHPGRWLVRHLAGVGEIDSPPRLEGRASPFEGWADEDFADEAAIAERLAAIGAPSGKTGEPSDRLKETGAKRLVVNGEPNDVAVATLAEALAVLGYSDAVVATALNGEFVSARKREATLVKDGDRIEIVAPRQGG